MTEPRRPHHWDEMYPGRFMKAGQLGEKKHIFTIADVQIEALETDDGGTKDKGFLIFKETPFQLPLNKTNGICLKAMFGARMADWSGKQVVLFQSPVESGSLKGEPAIRIYGSPHLTQDMHIKIKHPKKKAFPWTLHAPKPRAPERTESNGGT